MGHVVTTVKLDASFSDMDLGFKDDCYLIVKKVDNVSEAANTLMPFWQNDEFEGIVPMLITIAPLYPIQNGDSGDITPGVIWPSQQQQALAFIISNENDRSAATKLLASINDDDIILNKQPFAMVNYLQNGLSSLLLGAEPAEEIVGETHDATEQGDVLI